jgi:hypothetical protein
MTKEDDDRTETLLKQIVEDFWKEDQATRERQVREWRRLKLLWEGFSRTWYSEVAHDWRIYDPTASDDGGQEDYYDKPVNVFRAYLESIIAALSVTVPAIKCFPDDADNTLDNLTAKAGDKIAKLVYRHNDAPLLWLQGLFIYCTEGMTAAYSYSKESKEYGEVKEPKYENVPETHQYTICSNCQTRLADVVLSDALDDRFNPSDEDIPTQDFIQQDEELCPECMAMMQPTLQTEQLVVSRLVGTTSQPKARQCIEVYGGLNVKVANYARKTADTPYLIWSFESHYSVAREKYPNIRNCIQPGENSGIDYYEKWARLSPQYQGEWPMNLVTERHVWLRPCAFQTLDKEDAEFLFKKFPNGARVIFVNEEIAEYCNESLDDKWTLTQNPLSDYIYFDPLGTLLTSVQEITNDIISLTLQTIEHGIPQTFADPAVLNFNQYQQQETTPGAIYPATPKSGKSMSDAFYEVRTATLSQEVLPFANQIQALGQTVSGALPSLFGGDIQGSKTASQYSMSRAQALQRLQNTWKMFTMWWKQIFGKVIPAYIEAVVGDEKYVEKDASGNFINIVIHRAELEGKLGQIELEANENLPVSFAQQKDAIMQMMQTQHPLVQELLMAPENLPLLYEALGIADLYIPGQDSRDKQYDEIKVLLQSEPIQAPPDPMMMQEMQAGKPVDPAMMQPQLEPSVPVDEFDNDQIELEICIKWLNSEAGKQAKAENQPGYQNVVLHAKAHKTAIQFKMMEQMQQQMMANPMPPGNEKGASSPERPKETDKEAPITGDGDVTVN